MENFNEIGLKQPILDNLARMGYETPTDIQSQAIPEIMSNQDTVMQAHTGSGKTAAFGIPLIQSVMPDVPAVQFVILVPTRELAKQVTNELVSLAQDTDVNVVAIYGGTSIDAQFKALGQHAHIVVGTPGRTLDHLKRRTMTMSVVRGLVLDEADKMLSMGFLPEMKLIFQHLPKRHQTIMSSATFPASIEGLIHRYMNDPVRICLSSDQVMPKEIKHLYCTVPLRQKDQALLSFIEKEEPELSLIFCNTKIEVKALSRFLIGAGINAIPLSSDLTQKQRELNLQRLRFGQVNHLVCTDVASRGIDIPNLTHVFIYSTSEDLELYVHRTGRTGRAGKPGIAISLVATVDLPNFIQALKTHGVDAEEIEVPTEEEILATRVAHHIRALETINYAADADIKEEFMRLSEALSEDRIHALFPFLLERFLLPKFTAQEQEYISSTTPESRPPRSSSSPRERPPRGRSKPSGRKRAPALRSYTTVCLALGTRDGLKPVDVQNLLKRQGKAEPEDIGRIDMHDHESFVNVGSRSLGNVLAADGKWYRSQEIYVAESPAPLEEESNARVNLAANDATE